MFYPGFVLSQVTEWLIGFIMYAKRYFVWLSIAVFIVAIVNVMSRKVFSFSYTRLLPYDQIYYQDEQLRIVRIAKGEHDSLVFEFKGAGISNNNLFEVSTDSILFLPQKAKNLTIKPYPGRNEYFLRVNGQPKQHLLNIDYSPPPGYEKTADPSVEVTSRDLLISSANFPKLSEWDMSSFWKSDLSDKEEINRYLGDSMHVAATDSTEIKALKIAQFLLWVTKGRIGIPSDSLIKFKPIQQLEYIRSGDSQLWCGNYAFLFSFFSSHAGIKGRIVGCGSTLGDINMGVHVFNEVFLPEWNRWAYIDLTEGNIFVRKGNTFLNTIDINALLKTGTSGDDNIVAYHFSGDSIVHMPFGEVSKFANYYFHPGNAFQFLYPGGIKKNNPGNLFERALKFFYLKPYYATYSDDANGGNYQFYLRIITNYLLVLLCILWVFAAVVRIKKRRMF